jgi:hypothetical protein
MDFYHDTSFRSILNSIFLAYKIHICFCLGKEIGLWLVAKPSIFSFHIAHSIFILMLRFCFGLI